MSKMLGLLMVTRTSEGKDTVVIISPEDKLFFVPSDAFDENTAKAADALQAPGVIGALGAIFEAEV